MIKLIVAISLFVCIIQGSFVDSNGLYKTPSGKWPIECVHHVPSGSHIKASTDGTEVTLPDGSVRFISPCQHSSKIVMSSKLRKVGDDYDGWLAYTTYQAPKDIDAFLGYFSVPNEPENDPEVLYLFTGLQNVDWIPLVDPEPSVFDIIQPVLQYPGDNGNYWSLKSWYVTLTNDVLVSNEIACYENDNVFGNMTRLSTSTWYIGSYNAQGDCTNLTVTRNVLTHQPWAYNTAECYGCEDCSYEPTNGAEFTKLLITYQGKQLVPNWTTASSPNPICSEKAVVNSPNSVTITFQQ